MKLLARLAVMTFLGAINLAHAGFLDDVNKVMDTAKKAANMVPGSATPQTAAQGVPSNGIGGASALDLPFDLNAYPRSKQQTRIYNPLERVSIPLSTPQNTPDGYVARYSVPMEGKVTMLQFVHRSDDSPLLIKQYYEAWLAQAGFERMLVCEAPCGQLSSRYSWQQAVDPSKRLDPNYIPGEPTYIAAYKADAMVLVGVGKLNYEYVSLVKVVEGRILDAQAWKTLNTAKPAMPAVPPSRPPAQLAGAVMPAPAAAPQPATAQQTATKQAAAQAPATQQASTDNKDMASWYGKYGWKWDLIPAGTNLRISEFLGLKTLNLYAEAKQNADVKAVLQNGEAIVFRGRNSLGFVYVGTRLGDAWADARTLEPIQAANALRMQPAATAPGNAQTGSAPATLTASLPGASPVAGGADEAFDSVEMLAASDLASRLSASKGFVTVQISSFDPGCPHCVQVNPKFDELATRNKGKSTFWRVMWQPWASFTQDAFSKAYGVNGLPTSFTFKNGQLVRRSLGNLSVEELEKQLLRGLR
ncbi:MAG: thioredoxin family protein [Burkholderiales bacterium]|nr:thioredoxin family protein [Burkholderiales bacterium]